MPRRQGLDHKGCTLCKGPRVGQRIQKMRWHLHAVGIGSKRSKPQDALSHTVNVPVVGSSTTTPAYSRPGQKAALPRTSLPALYSPKMQKMSAKFNPMARVATVQKCCLDSFAAAVVDASSSVVMGRNSNFRAQSKNKEALVHCPTRWYMTMGNDCGATKSDSQAKPSAIKISCRSKIK